MRLISLLILPLLISTAQTKQLFDDWPWSVVRTLAATIKVGDEMKGKTIDQFQPGKNEVEPAGVVDNHSKWSLRLYDIEEEDGTITVPLKGAQPGTREVFASRKNDYAFLGSEVRYSFVIDDDIMLHVTYDVPLMRAFGNTLSLALCEKTSATCRNMKAADMLHNNYPFLKKKNFEDTKPIGICYDNLCFVGSMGVSARPVIELAILPMSFYGLDEVERKRFTYLTPRVYNNFMKILSNLLRSNDNHK